MRLKKNIAANITRRAMLAGIGASAAIASGAGTSHAQASFDWRRHSGTTLKMLANRIAPGDLLVKQLPSFEAKTGIKVTVQSLPEEQFRQRQIVEMTAGNSDIDVFMTLIGNEGVKFVTSGWYEPIKPFLEDPSQTSPDYDAGDIGKGAWDSQTILGKLIAVPIEVGGHCMMINKTLFEAAGVASPKTLDEMEQAAKRLTDKGKDIAGISLRGRRGQAVGIYSNFLHNMGGNWLSATGEPMINTPEAIAAFEMYGRLLRLYGPPGSTNHGFSEVNGLLMAGKAAIVIEGTVFAGIYENPATSRVAGQIGYRPLPVGPGGDRPNVNGWGIAMYSGSKKKSAAWTFMQWASGKEALLGLAMGGQGSPRASVWNDPSFKAASNSPQDWQETLQHTVKVGTPFFAPPVIPVLEARDIIGDVIVESITGGNVRNAAIKANDLFKKALENSK